MPTKIQIGIKKEAFRNMITHVLKYASHSLEQKAEVIGICMGKKDARLEIINAIPLTHGIDIDIANQKEILDVFATTEEQYQKKNLFVVGWYCSNPNAGLEYADKHVKNHMFFKRTFNNDCVSIIFDHAQMVQNQNLGFKAFIIDDSGVNQVEIDLEIPKTFDFFNWVKKFVEDSQKKAPILIKEISEVTNLAPNDLQEIPLPQDYFIEDSVKDEYARLEPISDGFTKGASNFSEIFMGQFLSQLSNWSRQFEKGAREGPIIIQQTIEQMKDALSLSMGKIERWFSKVLEEKIKIFEESMTNYIEERIISQNQVAELASSTIKDVITQIKETIRNNLQELFKNINDKSTNLASQIEYNIQNVTDIDKNLTVVANELEKIVDETTVVSGQINKSFNLITETLTSNLSNSIDKLNEELSSIQKLTDDINQKFSNLRKDLDI
ncbi:MAG: hypothetical protein JW891_18940 [Candidatus Lokiarchaeota archaeon]|nr:hypothetical protein [Candidatus Lokiarchaeota archaeon]